MKLDFTPRRLLAPNTPEEAAKLNQEIEKLVGLYQKVDKLSAQQARSLAEAQVRAGNLANEIKRLEKSLDDLIFASDYLYRSFQEQTAELRNQNVLLKIGKSAFTDLTNQAQKLFNFQQGYSDLQEKDFKKIQSSLNIQGREIDKIIGSLGKNEEFRKDEIRRLASIQESGEKLTKTEKERLNTLLKEQGLYEAAKDAQEGGLKLLEKEYQISKQIYKVKQDLGGLASAAAGVISKYGGSLAQFLDISEATEAVNEYNRQVINDALQQKDVVEKLQQVEAEKVAIQQRVLDAAKAERDAQRELNLAKEAENGLSTLKAEQKQKQNQFDSVGNELATKRAELERLQNDTSAAGIARRSQAETELNELIAQHNTLKKEGEDISKRIEDSNSKISSIGFLQNDLEQKKIDLKEKEASIDDQIAAKEQEAYNIKEKAIAATNTGLAGFINKFKSLGVLTSKLAGGLQKALTDPLTIATFIIDKALEANKQTVELGKSLGYGVGRADAFREKLVDIERSSSNINVNTKNLTEAFNELVQATGFAYEFTADQLETQIKLTKQVGLQANEAAQIQRFAVITGKTSEETYKSFVKGLATARNQLRVGINFKAALAEAANVSGQLAANLRFNPELIAKAVVQVKALGLSFDQLKSSTSSLLDFASSIENELQAELLLGREINLERARAAALAGDQITLAEELAKNFGSAADFTKLNVLQQEALAKSMGMTADGLAETLRKREEALASGKSLAQITKEEAAQALERQSIQDKFTAAIEKLQSLIGNLVAGPLGTFIDLLSGALDIVNKLGNALSFLATPLKVIAGIYLGIKATQLAIYGTQLGINASKVVEQGLLARQMVLEEGKFSLSKLNYILQKESLGVKTAAYLVSLREIIAERAKNIATSIGNLLGKKGLLSSIGQAVMGAVSAIFKGPTGFLGPLAIPIALTAGGIIGAFGYKFLSGDDVVSEGGYGKRTLLAPEGAIQLNNKDTVIAGTKMFEPATIDNQRNIAPVIQPPKVDFAPVVEAIKNLASRPSVAVIDGQKAFAKTVVTTSSQNSYKVA